MKIMNRKVFREIRFYKFRSLTIVAVIAISVALLTGLRASQPMVLSTYEENLIQNNVADGRFTFSSPILENNLSVIDNNKSFLSNAKIDKIEGRIILQTDLTYKGSKFPAVVIGVNCPNKVNKLFIEQQSSDISNSSNILNSSTNAIIETRFFGNLLGQDMQLDENISINFGSGISKDFTVKGVAQDTDFLYVVDPVSGMTLMGQMAVVWVNLHGLQNILFQGLPFINQILYTVNTRLDKEMTNAAADKLLLKFAEDNIDVSGIQFTIYDETVDRVFFDADAGSIDKVGTIFGLIGLVICAVIIFNTLNRMVQAQSKNIGLFLAMGSPRKKIISHYIKITMVLAGIGCIIGIPLGYGLAIGMVQMIVSVFTLHYFAYTINYLEFLYGVIAILATSLTFSAISVRPITKSTPREAMTATFNRIKITGKSIAEKLFGWIPLFRPIHMTIPLREIFLRKKRSAFTVLALTTSMIILINSVAMVYNMYKQVDDNYSVFNTQDVSITLENPMSIDEIEDFMKNNVSSKIEYFEIYLDIYTKITINNEFKTWTHLQAYQENSTLRTFNIIEGDIRNKKGIDSNNIIIGQSIAGKYDIDIGDKIEIGLLGNYSVSVSGKTGELIDYNVLWTLKSFGTGNISTYFGLPKGYANGILIKVADNTNMDELRIFFEKNLDVSQWTESSTAKNAASALMNTIMSLLAMFILVGVGIGVMFSFSSMYLAFIDREEDFIALRAMGTKPKYIKKIIFWENTFLSIFSLIITIPIGYLVYRQSMTYMMGDKFYFPLTIPWFTWILVFLLSMFSIWLATRKLMKKIRKTNLADQLRQREIS
jgi:putative ABC transport system permease protein